MRSFKSFRSLSRRARVLSVLTVTALGGAAALAVPGGASGSSATPGAYQQTNLVSDIPGVARITDPHLVNPWGMSASPSSPLWISDNGSNVSTLYTGGKRGSPPQIVPLVVTIPGGAPTGTVFNPTSSFVVTNGRTSAPANFIFDSENGRITAWSGAVPPSTVAKNEFTSPTAVYKGLAMASTANGPMLYATNFHDGTSTCLTATSARCSVPGAFTDPSLPAGYAPFGIQAINGSLYVSYAKQDAARHDDVQGPGHGFIDVYDTSGTCCAGSSRVGRLNSPWGLVAGAPHVRRVQR